MSNALNTAEALLERRRDSGCVENFPSVLRTSNMVFKRGKLSRSDAKGSEDPIRLSHAHYTITIIDVL
jgi:hypothetical protein